MGDLIRHVDMGGQIEVHRDPHYPGSQGYAATHGRFTHDALKDFVLEAEVAGVEPHDQLWFQFTNNRAVEYMYFPLEGHQNYRPPRPAPSPVSQAFMVLPYGALALVFIVGMIAGWLLF